MFKSKEVLSREEVAAFLHQLADKIAAGRVTLQQGKNDLPLKLPADLLLEVEVEDEHKKRGIEHCLEVEIKWYDEGMAKRGSLKLK